MNDKFKFYRSTLVQMTKEAYRKMPKELKTEEAVVEAELLTKAIMKQVDEYENSFNYQTQANENSTITCTDPNFFKGVNPDYLKTEPIKTIVDNGPQYQANQKPYGTLGEHWYELMKLFEIKDFCCLNWKSYFNEVVEVIKENKEVKFNSSAKNVYYTVIKSIVASLGIEFIEDFVKACEKCEE